MSLTAPPSALADAPFTQASSMRTARTAAADSSSAGSSTAASSSVAHSDADGDASMAVAEPEREQQHRQQQHPQQTQQQGSVAAQAAADAANATLRALQAHQQQQRQHQSQQQGATAKPAALAAAALNELRACKVVNEAWPEAKLRGLVAALDRPGWRSLPMSLAAPEAERIARAVDAAAAPGSDPATASSVRSKMQQAAKYTTWEALKQALGYAGPAAPKRLNKRPKLGDSGSDESSGTAELDKENQPPAVDDGAATAAVADAAAAAATESEQIVLQLGQQLQQARTKQHASEAARVGMLW